MNLLSNSDDRKFLPLLMALFVVSNVYFSLHFLDDAFIHLRYAESLATTGVIQYNPGQPGYGTSSPLFVYVLAGLVYLGVDTIWITKAVSVVFHLILVLQVFSISQRSNGAVRNALVTVSLLLAMPMSARWMANGMETSMVAVLAVWLGQLLTRPTDTPRSALVWCFAHALACVARPEFFPIAVISAVIVAFMRQGDSRRYPLIGMGVGIAIALMHYQSVFGHVTPDTAIAKSAGFSLVRGLTSFPHSAMSTAIALASSSTLGIAMALILGLSTMGVRREGAVRIALAVVLLAFAGLIFMIAARGQAIQGVRYFVFIIFFMVPLAAWTGTSSSPEQNGKRWRRMAAVSVAVFLVDALLCWPIVEGRSETTLKFIRQPFANAASQPCVGYDIGYFTYFSGCHITDMAGLVNGREAASLTQAQRLEAMKGTEFQWVFVNEAQLHDLEKVGVLHRDNYNIVQRFDFPNINHWKDGKRDTHYLMQAKPRIR